MPHISIRPGDSLTIGGDITVQFDKLFFFDGCAHLDIDDAYDEVSVVQEPALEPTEEVMQVRLRELAQEIASTLSVLNSVQSKALLDSFVSELFISVAKQELRETRRQRQAEGIATAKAKGVRFGPTRKPLPVNFDEYHRQWRDGEITMREAAEACGMAKSSFYDAVMRKERFADRAV